jgi:PhoPQ-activated pathogenicity-related protein
MRILVPSENRHPGHAVLLISGGDVRERTGAEMLQLRGQMQMLPALAAKIGAPVVLLEQVPNQPLFDGKREDAIIALTLKNYLETGDESWPALLPMVKAAQRAMDATQEICAKELGAKIEKFCVTGASKRGWTTWLTACNDARVEAIAPAVIDVLHMAAQMPHQKDVFGDYSDKIADYTALGLPQKADGPEAARLLSLIDPWMSRDKLAMPKLLLLGTNDPYWPVDAASLYVHDLPGETHIHYLENAGHGLGPDAFAAAADFFESVMVAGERARLDWKWQDDASGLHLRCTTSRAPDAVEVVRAEAPTRDFRKAQWTAAAAHGQAIEDAPGSWHFDLDAAMPESGWRAQFVRVTFNGANGQSETYCTDIRMFGKPAAPRRARF